jgi:hypothetical protein
MWAICRPVYRPAYLKSMIQTGAITSNSDAIAAASVGGKRKGQIREAWVIAL